MRAFASLCVLYVRNTYNIDTNALKGNPKKIAATIGIGLLIAFAMAEFAFMSGIMAWIGYDALAAANMQSLALLNGISMATVTVILFGFLTVITTYFVSDAETGLLALPLTPRQLLGAKMFMVYVSEFLVGFLLLAGTVVAYGIKSGAGAGFYATGFLVALSIPLAPIAISYLVVVPFVKAFRFLRNKNAIMMIGSLVAIGFALLYNVYSQGSLSKLEDPVQLAAMMSAPDAWFRSVAAVFPPTGFALNALTSASWTEGALWILALFAMGIGACVLVVLALGPAYAHGLTRFNELRIKKLASADTFIRGRFTHASLSLALVRREFALLVREPVYLLNGPLTMVLVPAIFAIMLASNPEMLAGVTAFAAAGSRWQSTILATLFGAGIGTMMSIACSSVSREGKSFPFLKSLPVDPAEYMKSKFALSMLFSSGGVAVGIGCAAWMLGLDLLSGAIAFAAAIAFASFHNCVGLYLDALMPKLKWENPAVAIKQNWNTLIAMLLTFLVLGLCAFLAFGAWLAPEIVLAALAGASLAGFALLYGFMPRFSRARFAAIE